MKVIKKWSKCNLQTSEQTQKSFSGAVDNRRGSMYWEQWPNKAKYQTVNNLPVNCQLMKNTEMQQQQLSLSAWLPSSPLPFCLSTSLFLPLATPIPLSLFFLFTFWSCSPSSDLLLFLAPRLVSVSRIRLGELCRRGNCQKYSVWIPHTHTHKPRTHTHSYSHTQRGVEGTPIQAWALLHEGIRRGTWCFWRGKGHCKALLLKQSWCQNFLDFLDWN